MSINKIWYEHLRMQTILAYPGGPCTAPTMHVVRAAQFGLSHAQQVLVIGPGTFHELEAVRLATHPITLWSFTAFEVELTNLEAAGFGNTLVGDMHNTPYRTGFFDLVFSSNVFEHAIAPHMLLLEMRRVLKVGGRLHFVVPRFESAGGDASPWHVYCLDERMWLSLLHKSGFRAEAKQSVEDVGGGALESYHHLMAEAVEKIPAPMNELFDRIVALKAEPIE